MSDWTLHLGDGGRRLVGRLFRCEQCSVEFCAYVRPSRSRRFCSNACRCVFTVPSRNAQRGPEHHSWSGDDVSVRGGRSRALRLFRIIGACVKCGADKAERHHVDGNTANNDPSNVEPLCRRCHMSTDGRLASVTESMRTIQPLGVAARWR